MPITNAEYLPSYEDLNVPELNMSSAPLRAGAHHFGKYCDNQSKEFMLCNQEEKDPRKCLQEGKEVTRCAFEFFRKVKEHCASEFTDYWKCVDTSSYDLSLKNCRKSQAVFDDCVFEHLKQERPGLGYFSKARVHQTSRPKPQVNVPLPDPIPGPENIDRSQPPPESIRLGVRSPVI